MNLPMLYKVFFSVSILCLTISCSYKKAEFTAPAVNEFVKGEKFRINLPEIHSDGYLWHIQQNKKLNAIEHVNSVWHGEKKGVDFNFKALNSGTDTLNFAFIKYRDTLKTVCFIIKVK